MLRVVSRAREKPRKPVQPSSNICRTVPVCGAWSLVSRDGRRSPQRALPKENRSIFRCARRRHRGTTPKDATPTCHPIDGVATSHSPSTPQAGCSSRSKAGLVFSLIVSFLIRLSLVALFLPFSALDKLLNPEQAAKQAQGSVHARSLAWILIGAGFYVEVVMSLAVLTGFFDRLAAVILAGYCAVTALLWKRFWKTDNFRLKGPSKGRQVFWDF